MSQIVIIKWRYITVINIIIIDWIAMITSQDEIFCQLDFAYAVSMIVSSVENNTGDR